MRKAAWVFMDWTENGFVLSASSNYTFAVSSDQQLVANFLPATNLFVQQPSGLTNEAGTQVSFSASVQSPARCNISGISRKSPSPAPLAQALF